MDFRSPCLNKRPPYAGGEEGAAAHFFGARFIGHNHKDHTQRLTDCNIILRESYIWRTAVKSYPNQQHQWFCAVL